MRQAARMASVPARPSRPEEGTGDATRGVRQLFNVNSQREEIELVLGVLANGRDRQGGGGIIQVGQSRAGGLLGETTEAHDALVKRPLSAVTSAAMMSETQLPSWGRFSLGFVGVALRFGLRSKPMDQRSGGASKTGGLRAK